MTCHQDTGTGTGKSVAAMVDYRVPTELEQKWIWTITMLPLVFEAALKAKLAHMDASDWIAKQSSGKDQL